MDVNKFRNEIVTDLVEQLRHKAEVLPETEKRSTIKRVVVESHGETFTVMEQNTKKPSKFAKLAKNGHEVVWIVREENGQWHLIVDGVWCNREKVTEEGEVQAGAAL